MTYTKSNRGKRDTRKKCGQAEKREPKRRTLGIIQLSKA
jgi:hypothetical protein